MAANLSITLYDNDNEVIATYTRTFVPWKLLKRAIKLAKGMNVENMTEESIDELSALVVDVFGDKFTVDQLDDSADVGQMMSVLTGIMSIAQGPGPNPPPQKRE
jgi:hypothetical protein